jgi:hypothetical protein
MAEPRVLTSLRKKRADIEDLIATLDKRLALARRDLAHISATIELFQAPNAPGEVRAADNSRGGRSHHRHVPMAGGVSPGR